MGTHTYLLQYHVLYQKFQFSCGKKQTEEEEEERLISKNISNLASNQNTLDRSMPHKYQKKS